MVAQTIILVLSWLVSPNSSKSGNALAANSNNDRVFQLEGKGYSLQVLYHWSPPDSLLEDTCTFVCLYIDPINYFINFLLGTCTFMAQYWTGTVEAASAKALPRQ